MSGDYIISTLNHDSAPTRSNKYLEITEEDGEVLVSSLYSSKGISIEGIIKGTTQENLEINIDKFKREVCGINITLSMTYAGRTREYNVDVKDVIVTREHHNITFAPFSMTLIAADPPFAVDDTMEGLTSVTRMELVQEFITAVFSGTAEPKPTIKMTVDTAGSLSAISFKNKRTDTSLSVTTAWADSDVLEIDTANKSVQRNTGNIEFEGIFPQFNLGENEMQITFTSSTQINQQNTDYNVYTNIYGNRYRAQSFQVSTATTYNQIDLLLSTNISVNNAPVTIRVETDNSNKPSGTLVDANATATISADVIHSYPSWHSVNFTPFSLSTGTKYWLVVNSTGSTTSNYPQWHYFNQYSVYANGNASFSNDAGANWTDYNWLDMTFKIYSSFSVDWSVDMDIDYYRRYL